MLDPSVPAYFVGGTSPHFQKPKMERLASRDDPAEKILWQELRGNKLSAHFRSQQVIAGFIVDFYCHKAGLVIELDGDIHEDDEQKENDAKRDKALNELELRIIRFRNEEVLMDLSYVVEIIQKQVSTK